MNTTTKSCTPKLRLPEFEGDWRISRLGEICKFGSGGTPSKEIDEYWGGSIPWISAASMHDDVISNSDRQVTEFGAKNGTKLVEAGTLLLLVRGSMLYNRIPAGIVSKRATFNQDVKSLKPSAETTEPFLLLQIRAKEHKLLSLVVGTGIGAGKLDSDDLRALPLGFPSLPEQKKIADFLGAVDAKLAALREKEAALIRFKRGLMQALFSQTLRFTRKDGSNYPDWEEKRLNQISLGKLSNGVFNDPTKVGSGYRLINVKDMYSTNIIDPLTLSKIDIGENDFKKNQASWGDIFFTRSSLVKEGIAYSNVLLSYDEDITFDGHLIRLKPDLMKITPLFIYYSLSTNLLRKQLVARGKTGTMTTIGQADISSVQIPIPGIDEQKKIADALSAMDATIRAVTSQITQLTTFKKGLLQQMFV